MGNIIGTFPELRISKQVHLLKLAEFRRRVNEKWPTLQFTSSAKQFLDSEAKTCVEFFRNTRIFAIFPIEMIGNETGPLLNFVDLSS